jgi:hypothetical protein
MSSAWIVHISDLHVGGRLSGGGLLPKVMGHERRALEALSTFLRVFHRSHAGEDCALVVSGDVTAKGSPDELSFYETLVHRGVAINDFTTIGPLRERFTAFLEIPGNHDYWSGAPLPSPVLNPDLRSNHFSTVPWSVAVETDNHVVGLHGLCSTSGASPAEQVLAVGALSPIDRGSVGAMVGAARTRALALLPPKRSVHLLVTHHSPSDGTPLLKGWNGRSRLDLESVCAAHRIRGLLTGHAHTRRLDDRADPTRTLPPEARCATTLQDGWLIGSKPIRELLVHELYEREDGQSLGWRVVPWHFDGQEFKGLTAHDIP